MAETSMPTLASTTGLTMEKALQDALEGRTDFQGQKAAENIAKSSLTIITALSFFFGFVLQSLSVTFATFTLCTLLLAIMVIPPWPIYNKHPVKWLPAKDTKKSQ